MLKTFDPRLGWKKDPYSGKDFIYSPRIKEVQLPQSVDLSKYLPTVRTQGEIGSCTGFGIGGNITGLAILFGVLSKLGKKPWFSPWWIYNGARYIAGELDWDSGAYPRDCLDWLRQKGCLAEDFWPYQDGETELDTTTPPSKFEPEATKWPIISYSDVPKLLRIIKSIGFYRITGGAAGICQALADAETDILAGKPEHLFVSIGTPWWEKWMNTESRGVLPKISSKDSIAGGHETFLYGYNLSNSLASGQNSWSTNWGKGGRYLMPLDSFEIMKKVGGYDAHVISVSWNQEPIPPPEPTPITGKYQISGTVSLIPS